MENDADNEVRSVCKMMLKAWRKYECVSCYHRLSAKAIDKDRVTEILRPSKSIPTVSVSLKQYKLPTPSSALNDRQIAQLVTVKISRIVSNKGILLLHESVIIYWDGLQQ